MDIEPFWRRGETAPTVGIVAWEKDYQLTAELPRMEEKDVELKAINDVMTIKAEKTEEKDEKKKDYYLLNVATAPSSGPSRCPMAWMPTRLRRTARRAF
jgi:HSP20 family molecular chaperone IbpA